MTKTESNNIKQRLRKEQGHTLKSFADANGFKYRDVSDIVRGVRRGYWGVGREIAQKLGINPEA